ncbi:hypothetical protein EIP86_011329 [Pleurotus ostreatoroseus]|nr:hypothetical protein EIP86_011329 [Pleurotus ostreatoroseus]
MPFAHIASEWIHENQSVPEDVAQKLSCRAQQNQPTVRGITLDTNFSKIGPSHHGHISMLVQGVSGVLTNATTAPPPANIAPCAMEDRSLSGRAQPVSDSTELRLPPSSSIDKSTTIAFDVSRQATILEQTEECAAVGWTPGFIAGITVGVEANVNANVTFGVVTQGTLVPPKMSSFELSSIFDLNLDGTLTAQALADIALSSGLISLADVELPGLDFPGIFTLSPSFQLDTEAEVSLTGDVSLSVDIAYSAKNGVMVFPPSAGSSGGIFAPADTNIQLSAVPGVAMDGAIVAHVIPSLVFGVNAFSGTQDVKVTLGLDAQAKLDLELLNTPTAQLVGCTDMTTGLSVTATADGSFFGLFDATTQNIFSQNWEVFRTCLAAKREHTREIAAPMPVLNKRGITCAGNGSTNRTTVVNETVPANQMQPS